MSDFTLEEIEKMRETVLKSDREKITNNVFDLSKPPVVPYRHQEFPKIVYDHSKSVPSRDIMKKMGTGNEELIHIPAKLAHRIVKDEKELKAALKAGFVEIPPVLKHIGLEPEEVEAEPEPETAA